MFAPRLLQTIESENEVESSNLTSRKKKVLFSHGLLKWTVLSRQKELEAQILTAVSSGTLFWILKILVSYSTVYYPG